MPRIKIEWPGGSLEVEGEETLVRELYREYKEKYMSRGSGAMAGGEVAPRTARGRTTARPRKESYQIVKDLDLSGRDGRESLKSFYAKTQPATALECNAVFTYYLEKSARILGITANHLYTCYKDVGEKVPGALRQSIIDTSFKKGWIDTKSMEDIILTTHGETLVEHQLPKR